MLGKKGLSITVSETHEGEMYRVSRKGIDEADQDFGTDTEREKCCSDVDFPRARFVDFGN